MLSLRGFHLLFILIAIGGADVFGVWALRDYDRTGSVTMFVLGVLTLAGGVALMVYAYLFVRKMDRAHIH